jgi:preprotein translocase subunit SecE
MTPKEKARELVEKFINLYEGINLELAKKYWAKQSALIVVDEILKSEPLHPSNVDWDDAGATHKYYYEAQREEAGKYWKEVKQEIEKIQQ